MILSFSVAGITFIDKWCEREYFFWDCLKFVSYKGGMTSKPPLFFSEIKRSVRNDLSLSKDDIWKGIRKNTRYDITKALQQDFIINDSYMDAERFITCYNLFLKNKKLNLEPITLKKIRKYKNNIIYRTIMLNSDWVVSHCYVFFEGYVELLYSISNSIYDNKTIGVANKLLHWDDLVYFKSKGCIIYDWGGLPLDLSQLPGISSFKLSFGGDDVLYKQYYSPLYRLAYFLKSKR